MAKRQRAGSHSSGDVEKVSVSAATSVREENPSSTDANSSIDAKAEKQSLHSPHDDVYSKGVENGDYGDDGSDLEKSNDRKVESSQSKDRKNIKRQKISSHDIQVARETAELFKSNIFKLQIDELVRELRLKDSHCILIEKVLHKLNNIIQEVPNSDRFSLEEASLCVF